MGTEVDWILMKKYTAGITAVRLQIQMNITESVMNWMEKGILPLYL